MAVRHRCAPASVSSSSTFGPCTSGPNAQRPLTAKASHPYLDTRNSFISLLVCVILMTPFSMSSPRPVSRGSATMVSLLRLLGVSAKHCSEEVSTMVSQNVTTGSATLTSTSAARVA